MGRVTRRSWAVLLGIILLTSVIAGTGRAETFVVSYQPKGYPPLYFGENDPRKGILVEILEAVSTLTNDTFLSKYATTARLKRDFGNVYDIEPGINPAWRPDQHAISVYTTPFMTLIGVVAIRTDKSFPVTRVEDLQGKRVGDVRGFFWQGWMPEDGGYIPDTAISGSMLYQKLHAKRYDIVLTNTVVAKYYAKELGLDMVFAKEIAAFDISLRLHISKQAAIERLNNALETLRQEGTIDAIIRKYTE